MAVQVAVEAVPGIALQPAEERLAKRRVDLGQQHSARHQLGRRLAQQAPDQRRAALGREERVARLRAMAYQVA